MTTTPTPLIMIAEDDIDARTLMVKYLRELDVRVQDVDDGTTAMQAIEKEAPALVIIDLSLPAMSGFEVCARIRERPSTKSVPVLVVTGRNSLEDHARAREVGVTKYMSKPFKKKDFLAAVKLLLKG
jgi:DNA-binding response OmpR family regulator